MPEICLATHNTHKAEELAQIFAASGLTWQVVTAKAVAPTVTWDETGTTFLENAKIKAQTLRPFAKDWVLADDSGLCVPKLGGAPGVYSSSYGGIEGDSQRNNQRLLRDISSFTGDDLKAFFTCTLYLISPQGVASTFTGELHGHLTPQAAGNFGFGYDPLFIPEGSRVTLAELPASEKNSISHRGRAVAKLIAFLQAL